MYDAKVIRNEGAADQSEEVFTDVTHYQAERFPNARKPDHKGTVIELVICHPGQTPKSEYVSLPEDGEVLYLTNSLNGKTRQTYRWPLLHPANPEIDADPQSVI